MSPFFILGSQCLKRALRREPEACVGRGSRKEILYGREVQERSQEVISASLGADGASWSGLPALDRDRKTRPVLGLNCSSDRVKVFVQFGQILRPG